MASLVDSHDDEPKYIKRKVKEGQLSLDYEKRALIVSYEVEAELLGNMGNRMHDDRKKHIKKINLRKVSDSHTFSSFMRRMRGTKVLDSTVDRCFQTKW